MVGPPRGMQPPMHQPQAPHHQLIIKQMPTSFSMLKPSQNYVNYLSLPMMSSNGSFLAPPPEANGTAILTVPAVGHGATRTHQESPAVQQPHQPHAHQYLIPKPEPFSMHNYSKHEPPKRCTNHQRIKQEVTTPSLDDDDREEGEEVRPRLDPSIPFLEQLVKMDHSYPELRDSREDDKESTISSDEKPEANEEGEETETAAEGEDSVTRCICNMEHDDGYMISCDECYVWQHVACVLPDTPLANSLPDMAYLCDICQPRELDRSRARELQAQRSKQLALKPTPAPDTSDDEDSDTQPPPKKVVARRRAEPIPRRPLKRFSLEGPTRKSDVRSKKIATLIEGSIRSKLVKSGPKGGRRDVTAPAPPPPTPPSSNAVGRRTKLKRKFENKAIQRRKSKSKDGPEPRIEKEEEKRKSGGDGATNAPMESVKSRCRMSHGANGLPMLVTTCRVGPGDPLAELRGKYLQSAPDKLDKPDILFHYRFPKNDTQLILDGSGRENVVRYARRSCQPNAQLKHCYVKGTTKLYLVAIDTLERNQQVTVPHGCVTTSEPPGFESCGKHCTYNPNNNKRMTPPRRRSRRTTLSEESDREPDTLSPLSPTHSERDRKLTREEKKIEQAMKIFAQMEKDTARGARKRDKVIVGAGMLPASYRRGAESDKESPGESGKPRRRRRRRKRRNSRKTRLASGTSSTGAGMSPADDSDGDVSSADELLVSPDKNDDDDAAGLLLALGGARHHHPVMSGRQTPPPGVRDQSENDSSPSTPLSSACLLVAAAVGPLAPGFKFPKTKKGMMNEWLGKSPDHAPSDLSPSTELGPPVEDLLLPPGAPKLSNLSNRLYYPVRDVRDVRENCAGFAGLGKKRWLRQAISEHAEPTEVPLESPPCPPDNVTPLKKRRLARESLTSDTPPLGHLDQSDQPEDTVFGREDDGDSPRGVAPIDLDQRVRAMQRDYLAKQGIDPEPGESQPPATSPQHVPENLTLPRAPPSPTSPTDPRPGRRVRKRSDPRVKRGSRHEPNGEIPLPEEDHQRVPSNMDLLVMEATKEFNAHSHNHTDHVESHDDAAPIRRKLSITEYLKRKKGSVGKSDSATSGKLGVDSSPVEQSVVSGSSDEDISPLLMPTPTLPLPFMDPTSKGTGDTHFKVEPTELERQRENLNERLRREFGLVITDDESARAAQAAVAVDSPPVLPEPEVNGFPESKLELPQSAIYPEGSSNPPNPFTAPYPDQDRPERRKFRK